MRNVNAQTSISAYLSEEGSVGEVGKGLDAGAVHGEGLQVGEFLEELLVFLAEVGNLELIKDQVGELYS